MKRLFSLLAIGLFTSQLAFGEILRLGGSANTSDPEKVWIAVVNGESSTVAKGTLMYFDTTADDGVTVKIIPINSASLIPACVMSESCATGKKCKCQTYGYADYILADGSTANISAGQRMAVSIYQGRVSGADNYVVGVALDANTSSGTLEGFIMLR